MKEAEKMEHVGAIAAVSLKSRSSRRSGQLAEIISLTHEAQLPALFDPEVDRNLCDLVWCWEGGGGAWSGMPVLRRSFSATEMSILERRLWMFRCAMAPYVDFNRPALVQAISGMLGAFPNMQRFDKPTAVGLVAGYLMIARQKPHWAIVKAAELVRSGGAGLNPSYCPSEPEFMILIDRLIEPYIKALRRAERLWEANSGPHVVPKPTQAEMEAKLGRSLGPPASSEAKASPPTPGGDGRHAERVMADPTGNKSFPALAARKARREAGFEPMACAKQVKKDSS